jgi:hypothetical protein
MSKALYQEIKKIILEEMGVVKSMTWGVVPTLEEFIALEGAQDFTMDLKGQDSLAWEYAMALSNEPHAGDTSDPTGLYYSIKALVSAPSPDDISDEQYEDVQAVLDSWYERYGDKNIEEAAWDLATSIMYVVGIEWI